MSKLTHQSLVSLKPSASILNLSRIDSNAKMTYVFTRALFIFNFYYCGVQYWWKWYKIWLECQLECSDPRWVLTTSLDVSGKLFNYWRCSQEHQMLSTQANQALLLFPLLNLLSFHCKEHLDPSFNWPPPGECQQCNLVNLSFPF